MTKGINIKKLEADLWESADLLRAGSKLTSNQYCMPVLGLIFLRYAFSRFKMVESEILKGHPSRGGRVLPVEASDFAAKSALYLPKEAQYDYLLNLPDDITAVCTVRRFMSTFIRDIKRWRKWLDEIDIKLKPLEFQGIRSKDNAEIITK